MHPRPATEPRRPNRGLPQTFPASQGAIGDGWSRKLGELYSTRWCPPSYVCWFIIPLTVDISSINHSYWSYKPTERYLGGTTLYLINSSHENHKIQNVTSRYFSINLLIQPPLCLGCWKQPCGWLVKFWRWFGGHPISKNHQLVHRELIIRSIIIHDGHSLWFVQWEYQRLIWRLHFQTWRISIR